MWSVARLVNHASLFHGKLCLFFMFLAIGRGWWRVSCLLARQHCGVVEVGVHTEYRARSFENPTQPTIALAWCRSQRTRSPLDLITKMGLKSLILGIALLFGAKAFSINRESIRSLPPDLDESKPTILVCSQRFHLKSPDKALGASNSFFSPSSVSN